MPMRVLSLTPHSSTQVNLIFIGPRTIPSGRRVQEHVKNTINSGHFILLQFLRVILTLCSGAKLHNFKRTGEKTWNEIDSMALDKVE